VIQLEELTALPAPSWIWGNGRRGRKGGEEKGKKEEGWRGGKRKSDPKQWLYGPGGLRDYLI